MDNHRHVWVDDTVRCYFKCECGASVAHEAVYEFVKHSERSLTGAVLDQLAKCSELVID